ncbi:tapasin-related protein [Megalops cyprinoides]|uniref:tapasin-related protein n=1 Tax=Megalops cyprinoides TaxID=118141 RepID=UPI00186453E4|nr:tapasin-related protein [Megalops cyprinoides]
MKLILFILSTVVYSGALGSQSLQDLRWLGCELIEDQILTDASGQPETRHHHLPAMLQFGQPGDSPIEPDTITFLVTGTKVDMRRYVEGGTDQLKCEIRRYSTGGIQMRWPGPGAEERDVWFTCTLSHREGLFVLTTFLRHTPATSADPQEDYTKMFPIRDRDTLVTTAVMVVLTRSPSVAVGLLREQTLHCQFAVDHKRPDLTVEWRLQRRGERSKLFSYTSRSGKSEGSGVSARAIGGGDASLRIPLTKVTSEGTYICSVYVPPLYGSHDIALNIQESPRASVNVASSLSLQQGEELKVVCDAQGYYPLDVQLEWLREGGGGGRLPEVLKNVLYSSHRHHPDGTYSLSAFFLLRPSLADSGYTYTCRVSHHSLRTPVRKSFTLTVTEPMSWGSVLWGVMAVVFIGVMVVVLVLMLRYLHEARREANKRKPY